MGTSIDPATTVHPGAIRAIFDHLIIELTPDGRPGPPSFVGMELDGWAEPRILTDAPALGRCRFTDWLPARGLRSETNARWSAPIFASGPAPRLSSEDIVSVLVEEGAARSTVNGRVVSGWVFANDAWVAWLGRPLSSAVVAIGEVPLTRP